MSQSAFALALGLSAKSYVSDMERTNTAAPIIAIRIQELSYGDIPAESICPKLAAINEARSGLPNVKPILSTGSIEKVNASVEGV